MFEVQDCSDVAFQVAMDYSYLLSMRVFVKECRNVETGHQKAEAALKSIRYVSALADFPTGEMLVPRSHCAREIGLMWGHRAYMGT